ncbi:uncharacterized protein LOC116033615 isoform X2 [Ipomoea triloba]|uniref:uncharacterized protein LOC116033615 isoform X2 n=1 Tax=Ipomoea triloba TaxID=35885 RepID=UPI00125DDECB|nr:uncharacterized protein LOC116033615 isoform X2 [Ipomoea triloba]
MGLKKPPEKENLPASTPTRGDDDDDIANASPLTSLPPANINDPIQFGNTAGFNETHRSTNDCNMTDSDDDEVKYLADTLLQLEGMITRRENDVQPVDAQLSSPKNIDKRVQTAGRERIREPLQKRSRTKLGTKEFAGDLSSPASGSGTSTFLANDDDAAMRSRPSENSLPFSQTEQTVFGSYEPSSANSGRSSALVGPTSSTNNQMYLPPGFRAQDVVGQTPSFTNIAGSMPPGVIYSHVPVGNRGLLGQNHLAQPFYGNSTRNMSPQSSMYFRTPMAYRGGFAAFARGNHLGGSGTQAFQGVPFSSSIQPVGQQFSSGQVMNLPPGSNYFSQGLRIQAAESSNIQPVMRNQFPIRFGISQADLFGTQQSGRYQQYQAPNVGYRMSFPSGQGIPSANVAVGIPRASNIHGHPPRGWSRVRPRSKLIPSAHPSLPPVVEHEMRDLDSTSSSTDSDSTPSPVSAPSLESIPSLQPSGEQCWLCKRDVAFTPDGPLSQPRMPPVVAVLPCHHVFHAECLEKITPKEQAEDPPCIPCVTGEP